VRQSNDSLHAYTTETAWARRCHLRFLIYGRVPNGEIPISLPLYDNHRIRVKDLSTGNPAQVKQKLNAHPTARLATWVMLELLQGYHSIAERTFGVPDEAVNDVPAKVSALH
jgi:hypothetical protein